MWRDFIQEFAERTPDRIALIDRSSGQRHSYAALAGEINRWSQQLLDWGVQPGERVALFAPNRLEHLLLFFACVRLGAILTPLNHRLAPQELDEIMTRVAPRCVLGVGASGGHGDFPYYDLTALELPRSPAPPPPRPVPDEAILLILFTSGSTGIPKGVLFHAAMLRANIDHTVGAGVLQPGDISIVNTPFSHTGGYNVFCLPLLSLGGTLILHEKFDPGAVLTDIREEGVTVFWAVPTMFQAIYDHSDFARTDFSRIRFLLSGGAPLSLALIQGYHQRGIPFKQGFGLSEVGPNCFLLESADALLRPDSIGKPMGRSQVKVVDEQGQEVGCDTIGELLITGPHLCRGYWRDEEQFNRSLRQGFFATGDLVRVDAAGFFYVVGRKKDMYISGGENVYPGEVEKQLLTHPDLIQAVVVSVPDDHWGEVGWAFFVSTREISPAEIRHHLNSRLARYKHPHHVQRLTTMPLLGNGKIDRNALTNTARRALEQKMQSPDKM